MVGIVSWRKSSYSADNSGNCVEAGQGPGLVAVRDSADRRGPRLEFSPAAWRRFTGAVKTAR